MLPADGIGHGLRYMLKSVGFQRVLEAEKPAEAISMLKEELVDLALIPWDVPGWSGKALFKALQHKGRNRGVPVILLDAGLPQSMVVAAVKAGVIGRLTLPAQLDELRKILAQPGWEKANDSALPSNGESNQGSA